MKCFLQKNKRKIIIAGLVATALFFFVNRVEAWGLPWFATEGNQDTIDFLRRNEQWLQHSEVVMNGFRSFGWSIVSDLMTVVLGLENALDLILDHVFGFFGAESLGIGGGLTGVLVNVFYITLLTLSFIFIALKFFFTENPPSIKKVAVQSIIAALLVFFMPRAMNVMQDAATYMFRGFISVRVADDTRGEGNTRLTEDILNNHVIRIDQMAFYGYVNPERGDFAIEHRGLIDINEMLTEKAVRELSNAGGTYADHLNYRLVVDPEGEFGALTFEDAGNWFGFDLDPTDGGRYMRHTFQFAPMFISLFIVMLAYVWMCIVLIKTGIELAFKQVIGMFIFVTDLETGQRTKSVIQAIIQSFLLIAFTGLGFRMFNLFIGFVNSLNAEGTINIFVTILAYIAGIAVLFKGSKAVMAHFGVDMGVQEGSADAKLAGAATVGLGVKAASMAKGLLSSPFKTMRNRKVRQGQNELNKSGLERDKLQKQAAQAQLEHYKGLSFNDPKGGLDGGLGGEDRSAIVDGGNEVTPNNQQEVQQQGNQQRELSDNDGNERGANLGRTSTVEEKQAVNTANAGDGGKAINETTNGGNKQLTPENIIDQNNAKDTVNPEQKKVIDQNQNLSHQAVHLDEERNQVQDNSLGGKIQHKIGEAKQWMDEKIGGDTNGGKLSKTEQAELAEVEKVKAEAVKNSGVKNQVNTAGSSKNQTNVAKATTTEAKVDLDTEKKERSKQDKGFWAGMTSRKDTVAEILNPNKNKK